MALRPSFVIWITGFILSLYFQGFVNTLIGLYTFHFVILRWIPEYVFGLRPFPLQSLGAAQAVRGVAMSKRYVWFRLYMEDGFSSKNYQDWVTSKLATDRDINVRYQHYGPEGLMLYYLKPVPLDYRDHVVVDHVHDEADVQKFIETLYNTTMAEDPSPVPLKTWCLPNAAKGPLVIMAFLHDMVDGEGALSFIKQHMDEEPLPPAHWSRFFYEFAHVFRQIRYMNSLKDIQETLTNQKDEPEALIKMESFDPKDYATHDFYDLPIMSVKEVHGLVRKHGITINDIFLTAYISAWHRVHKNHGITAEGFYCNFSKNMRTYPEPYRFENEFSVCTSKYSAGPVSLHTLKLVVQRIRYLKETFGIVYGNAFAMNMMTYILAKKDIEPQVWATLTCLIFCTSNLRGPSKALHIEGKKVQNLNTIGVSAYQILYICSYEDNLNLSLINAKNLGKEVVPELVEEFKLTIKEYLELLKNSEKSF